MTDDWFITDKICRMCWKILPCDLQPFSGRLPALPSTSSHALSRLPLTSKIRRVLVVSRQKVKRPGHEGELFLLTRYVSHRFLICNQLALTTLIPSTIVYLSTTPTLMSLGFFTLRCSCHV